MTKQLSDRLPDELAVMLDGKDLAAKVGETFVLATVNEAGWPHLALLSAGEVLAASATEVRLALWPRSTTSENLRRDGRATLAIVWQGTAYYVQLRVVGFTAGAEVEDSLTRFSAQVGRVLADRVDYAELTSGIRFELKDPDAVLRRWRDVIRSLS